MTKKQTAEKKIYSMQRFIFGQLDNGASLQDKIVQTSLLQLVGMMRMAIELDLFTPLEMDTVLQQIKQK